MDLVNFNYRSALRSGLPNRVRVLSKIGQDFARVRLLPLKSSRPFRLGISALFIIAALGTGKWAHDFSADEALHGWLGKNLPPETLWDAVLPTLGLKPLSDSSMIHRALKSLPPGLDLPGTVWQGGGGNWLAVFPTNPDTSIARVYCDDCRVRDPVHWEGAGRGWPALADIQILLQKRQIDLRKLRLASLAAKKPDWVDPREIRY